MGYRKNTDGSFTCFQLMKLDNTMLEVSAYELENAQQLLKGEIASYRTYPLVKTDRKFYSPGSENDVAHVYARDSLAEIINDEVAKEKK